jgi:hypothetical protein
MKAIENKVSDYPMVYLRWLDHNTHDGMWIETDDISRGPLVVETLGFLIDEDKLSYQVISSVCETGENEICRGFWYILKSDVQELVKL